MIILIRLDAMPPEVIDVDSFEPEFEFIGHKKPTLPKLKEGTARTRPSARCVMRFMLSSVENNPIFKLSRKQRC